MTTQVVADVLAYAERMMPVIRRDWPSFDAPVNVQLWKPYDDGRFRGQVVHHCGLSVGHIYAVAAGLRLSERPLPGTMPSWMQHSVYMARQAINSGPVERGGWYVSDPRQAQAGDTLVMDHSNVPGVVDLADHIELITAPFNGRGLPTIGWNTTPDGRGYRYARPLSCVTAVIRPRWPDSPTAPAPKPPTIAALGDDMATRILVPADPAGTMHDEYIYALGVLKHRKDSGVTRIEGASEVYMTRDAFLKLYTEYRAMTRTHPLTGKPL